MRGASGRPLLEICCGSLDDAIESAAGGADRVELCSDLFHGGLTPPYGSLVVAKERLSIPVMFMVRPRGGFCYTEPEFAAMQRDAEMAVANAADGLVVGILTPDGDIDLPRTARIRELANGRPVTFHRAFDVTPDPFRALDQLIDLGIARVLTSGQRDTVWEGLDLIARLVDYARGRIVVMPGGGIKPYHFDAVIAKTGCPEIHVAAWKTLRDDSTRQKPWVTFGGALYPPENLYDVTDRDVVAGLAASLRKEVR